MHTHSTFQAFPYKGRQQCEAAECQRIATATIERWQMLADEVQIRLSRYCAVHLATMRRDLKRDGFTETKESTPQN